MPLGPEKKEEAAVSAKAFFSGLSQENSQGVYVKDGKLRLLVTEMKNVTQKEKKETSI